MKNKKTDNLKNLVNRQKQLLNDCMIENICMMSVLWVPLEGGDRDKQIYYHVCTPLDTEVTPIPLLVSSAMMRDDMDTGMKLMYYLLLKTKRESGGELNGKQTG